MKITKKEFIMMLGGMFLMSAAVYYEMMPIIWCLEVCQDWFLFW